MSTPSSNRSSVSGASDASSTPSARSGYLRDPDTKGRLPSKETVRYERLGRLESIQQFEEGEPKWLTVARSRGGKVGFAESALERGQRPDVGQVLYTNTKDGYVSRETMKSRAGALAIARADKARRRVAGLAAKTQDTRTAAVFDGPASATSADKEQDELEYFGYVIHITRTDIFGRTAQVATSTGMLQPTTTKHYRDMTLPDVGMLVYKRSGEPWWGTLIPKRDQNYFGCIVEMRNNINFGQTSTAGQKPSMFKW